MPGFERVEKLLGRQDLPLFRVLQALPDTPPSAEFEVTSSGALMYGPGSYLVDWLFTLESGRSRGDSWTLRTSAAPELPGALNPGEVDAIVGRPWAGFPASAARQRATLFLHATPRPGARTHARLSAEEVDALTGTLRTILSSGHFNAARIVVFQDRTGRLLYESEQVTPETFSGFLKAVTSINLGTIEMKALERTKSRKSLLIELLLRECRLQPSSARVFLIGFAGASSDSPPFRWPARTMAPFDLTYLRLAGPRGRSRIQPRRLCAS